MSGAINTDLAVAQSETALYARTLEKVRNRLVHAVHGLQDEGDRVYLGSTNDADALRDLDRDLDTLHWDRILAHTQPPSDLYATIGALRLSRTDLLAQLKVATGHIEHMAAWITAKQGGYSFEGLGEDMPGIKAAIAKAEAGS